MTRVFDVVLASLAALVWAGCGDDSQDPEPEPLMELRERIPGIEEPGEPAPGPLLDRVTRIDEDGRGTVDDGLSNEPWPIRVPPGRLIALERSLADLDMEALERDYGAEKDERTGVMTSLTYDGRRVVLGSAAYEDCDPSEGCEVNPDLRELIEVQLLITDVAEEARR